MAEEGYITQAEAGAAQERPIVLQGQPVPDKSIAPYFAEEIRKKLETQYGASDLYEAGLTVQTTLDSGLQAAANRALDRGLRRIDKRHSRYRGPLRNVVADGHDVLTFSSDRWNRRVQPGDIVPAVVLTVPAKAAGAVRVRIGTHEAELTAKALAWTKKPAAELFKAGDLIDVEVRSVDDAGAPRELALEQTPLVQGAIVAIDNRTGQIRAMVGGLDFERSKFNRATQANRQVGSLFKPIVYTAAIDAGYTATSIFIDEPVAYPAGPGQPPYSPLNYDRKFEGPVTLRRALEQSRNIPAVQAMADVGAQEVIAYARRFGLPGRYGPYLSMALGAGEATLLEMTSAYSVFPNQGVRMEPYAVVSIADRNGNIREQHRPQPREAIPADTAFIMTNLMRGVVERGTATAAAALKWPLAGKTGTMDEYTDAWFIGFDPAITVGVWVGYDEKKPLGYGETGGAAALPIWIDVMRAYLERNADRKNPPDFEAPANIVFVPVEGGRVEAFINGTEPQEFPAAPAPAELRPPAPTSAAADR
jgi:penicillin-binding protein 1A